jgi:hypothetical protein
VRNDTVVPRTSNVSYPERMRWVAGVLVTASACYSPATPAGAPCDPALDNCPNGQTCVTSGAGSFCVGATNDGDTGDGPRPDSEPGCFGVGLLHDICVMPPPTTDVVIATDRTIDTAMVGNNNCDTIVAQPGGGPSLCVVAGASITMTSTAKLVGIGANPLLLVATNTIDIAGTIDVASRLSTPVQIGAGADMTCNSPAGANATVNEGAGAGGAGGSFATAGGGGGNGRQPGTNTQGANASAALTVSTFRGGCGGGDGGEADGGGGDGVGGLGGGAVYLIAGTSITIAGVVNASGSGGAQGTDGLGASGGAGGGGSGGMIGLDAPAITVTGQLFANGGGGGGGGGSQPNNHGQPGQTSTTALVAAQGGSGGTGGGGRGGNGSVLATEAANGGNGSNPYCGGGGGGGGAGIIRVFGVAPASLGGMISPPPT